MENYNKLILLIACYLLIIIYNQEVCAGLEFKVEKHLDGNLWLIVDGKNSGVDSSEFHDKDVSVTLSKWFEEGVEKDISRPNVDLCTGINFRNVVFKGQSLELISSYLLKIVGSFSFDGTCLDKDGNVVSQGWFVNRGKSIISDESKKKADELLQVFDRLPKVEKKQLNEQQAENSLLGDDYFYQDEELFEIEIGNHFSEINTPEISVLAINEQQSEALFSSTFPKTSILKTSRPAIFRKSDDLRSHGSHNSLVRETSRFVMPDIIDDYYEQKILIENNTLTIQGLVDDSVAKEVEVLISKNSNVCGLKLYGNVFMAGALREILKILQQRNITSFNIGYSVINKEDKEDIICFIKNTAKLTHVGFQSVGENLGEFINALIGRTNISSLDLSGNKISGKILIIIASIMEGNQDLKVFDLGGCKIENEDILMMNKILVGKLNDYIKNLKKQKSLDPKAYAVIEDVRLVDSLLKDLVAMFRGRGEVTIDQAAIANLVLLDNEREILDGVGLNTYGARLLPEEIEIIIRIRNTIDDINIRACQFTPKVLGEIPRLPQLRLVTGELAMISNNSLIQTMIDGLREVRVNDVLQGVSTAISICLQIRSFLK